MPIKAMPFLHKRCLKCNVLERVPISCPLVLGQAIAQLAQHSMRYCIGLF